MKFNAWGVVVVSSGFAVAGMAAIAIAQAQVEGAELAKVLAALHFFAWRLVLRGKRARLLHLL